MGWVVYGSDLEMGWVQGRHLGLGLDNCEAPSSSPTSRPPLDGPNSFDHSCLKAEAVGMGDGLSQGPLLRPFLLPKCKSPIYRVLNAGKKGNAIHIWEEGEFREDLAQENDRVYMNRCGDDLYEQSPSSLFSVFGYPLLPGGFSGLGGTIGDEDLEPLRVVAADGREWGLNCSDVKIEVGEELGVAGQRTEEAQNESSETWTYENWESSCLAKFSDFLGFPTKGFEKEILELLRNLVASQKIGKEKGNLTVSKSERELRRLKSTINYNGKKINKGGGRDRGNLLLKLK